MNDPIDKTGCKTHRLAVVKAHYTCPECEREERDVRRKFFFLAIIMMLVLLTLTRTGCLPRVS